MPTKYQLYKTLVGTAAMYASDTWTLIYGCMVWAPTADVGVVRKQINSVLVERIGELDVWNWKRCLVSNKKIQICSDSESSIESLFSLSSKIEMLEDLSKDNEVLGARTFRSVGGRES